MLRCVFVQVKINVTTEVTAFSGALFYKFRVNNGLMPREELVNKTAEWLVESELERGKGFVEFYPLQNLPVFCPESAQECAKLGERFFIRKNKIVYFKCVDWRETFTKEDFDTDESFAKVMAVKKDLKKRDEEAAS